MIISKNMKRCLKIGVLGVFIATNILPMHLFQEASAKWTKLVYPLKEISKLECRFTEFSKLGSNCKEDLPILKTKDYKKYAKLNWGYNKFTRLYTVLWGSSYKYGWDVWNWGHIWTDIATAKGTPIYSMADWVVIHAKNMWSLGLAVSIEHKIDGKKVVSNYAHMSKILTKKWKKVRAGDKIGLVGSTWNSTWNHLHFQLDLDTPFHPYYYNYNKCPYSYYKITEDWVCFNELQKNTIDPMKFLETNWSVLNSITVETVNRPTKPSSNNNSAGNKKATDSMKIFYKTVYVGYPTNDIKEVQQIFKDLKEYKWAINGNYKDLEKDLISYQLAKKIIRTKSELGAGRFGPKTRAQVKKDYQSFLDKGGKPGWYNPGNDTSEESDKEISNKIVTEKISRNDVLSREEIEAREIREFMKDYDIQLKFNNVGWNVPLNKTEVIKLTVTDKRKNRPFRWNMPGGMTFVVDSDKINVFPKRLYNFTDGKRDIKITGQKEWNTRLYIKIGKTTVKTFEVKVYNSGKTIYPSSSMIQGKSTIVLGDVGTGIGVFKDSSWRQLVNLPYGSSFKLKANADAKVCLKWGSISNANKIIKSKCKDSDYKQVVDFKYEDTVWGLIVYDFKVAGRNPKIQIVNNYKNQTLVTKNIRVVNPKGLTNKYAYVHDVLAMLEQGVADGINKWYFLEDRELKTKDALTWIGNALEGLESEATTQNLRTEIIYNKSQVEKFKWKVGRFDTITREQMLALTYEFLVFKEETIANRNFLDLDNRTDRKVASVFYGSNTWKDQFGQSYFRPKEKITRGEAAYFISNALRTNNQVFLTLK